MTQSRTSYVAGMLLLASVASTASPKSYWSGGVDDTAFYRDSYACIKENPIGPYMGHRYSTPENIRADKAAKEQAEQAATQMYNLCMRARGYVLRQEPDGKIIP